MASKNEKNTKNAKNVGPQNQSVPVVAVLGHVDHGKTTLLDQIRKTNIASKEHGGITQGIGASSVEISVEGVKKQITFIDTPGHEAFTHMRGRGTQAADIGLLVVSLVDGIMPQTKESIDLLKKAEIPFIVVFTKKDLLEINKPAGGEEKVRQQLLKEDVMLEGYGGDVPHISVSAKTGENIKELLELISLVFELRKKKIVDDKLKAIVIESKLDEKAGPKATVVVKSGELLVRDEIECEDIKGKVRTLIDDKGSRLEKVGVGQAVEILGFEKVPSVGAVVTRVGEVEKAPEVVKEPEAVPYSAPTGMPADFLNPKEEPHLSIVLCADTQGSLEAIVRSLPQEINIALQKTGDVTTTDILLAKSTDAIVLGFNVRIKPEIVKFAQQEKVLAKNYKIIYELLSEISDVLEGKKMELVEDIYGRAKVLASFPFEKTKVLGVKVLEGRVARGDKVRLIRKDEVVGESSINSVRIGKNVVSKIEESKEGGIILSPFLDFTIGDMLICHG